MPPKKVLLYVEPHPLRNSFTEFAKAGEYLAELLLAMDESKIQWRVYSNQYNLRKLGEVPGVQGRIIDPTEEENNFINSSLGEWTSAEIKTRLALIEGTGDVSDFYQNVLKRLFAVFEFEVLLIWSENGAVRSFSKVMGIPVLHMELGPTRLPFTETTYIDFLGTNGNVSFQNLDLKSYGPQNVLPSATWSYLMASSSDGETSILEARVIKPNIVPLAGLEYAVVALQLADDLNTLCHSPFQTPKMFLEYIIPALRSHGLKIFVKGHPGASKRPFNLVKEIEAIAYASSFADDVVVLDRNLPSQEFVPFLAGAAAVCSINSSVSFEALLLGVPGLVFGSAMYDIGSRILRASEYFLSSGIFFVPDNELDLLLTVLCRHILQPNRRDTMSATLQNVLLQIEASTTADEYFNMMRNISRHEFRLIDEELERTSLSVAHFDISQAAVVGPGEVMGFIEGLSVVPDSEGSTVSLQGWVARSGESIGKEITFLGLSGPSKHVVGWTKLIDRQDVRHHFPEINCPTGIDFVCTVPGLNEGDNLNLFFLTETEVLWQTLVALSSTVSQPLGQNTTAEAG